jgi:hypothetical protein
MTDFPVATGPGLRNPSVIREGPLTSLRFHALLNPLAIFLVWVEDLRP